MSDVCELEVCVTHWTIYRALRREPFALHGFYLCPIEGGQEHEVVYFVSRNEDEVEPGEET